MKRDEIAKQLLAGCPDELIESHTEIADAITSGVSKDSILDMCDDWPETYHYLNTEIAD